jgi:predicted house-cleaning noncanonical NTP pyrophosphatase (MazG superfamily)
MTREEKIKDIVKSLDSLPELSRVLARQLGMLQKNTPTKEENIALIIIEEKLTEHFENEFNNIITDDSLLNQIHIYTQTIFFKALQDTLKIASKNIQMGEIAYQIAIDSRFPESLQMKLFYDTIKELLGENPVEQLKKLEKIASQESIDTSFEEELDDISLPKKAPNGTLLN